MNKITATGRIVADADLRYTHNSDPICGFRVASDVGFGEKKSTNWFNCTIWGKRGESLAPHLQKGMSVTVFGTLTLREWVNKEGAKQLSPDIRIDEITMHGGRENAGGGAPVKQKPDSRPQPQPGAFDDEDPPF